MRNTVSVAVLFLLLSFAVFSLCSNAEPSTEEGSILKTGTFEKFQKSYNPWAGVDGQSYLRVFEAKARVVTNQGVNTSFAIPCSPNLVDMDGNGTLDIVVADPRGFTWFFANTGTPNEPKFAAGEVIPIMLSKGENQCPGLDAVDFQDNGTSGLIYGDWLGQIFFVPNTGSKTSPKFVQPKETDDCLVPTAIKSTLWGNYFYPALYDWDGDGRRDLIVGEGTYSANSIWLFLNQGNSSTSVYNDKEGKRIALVRGLGREHLTPVIVDWNKDGLPDIVTGERQGTLSVYINESVPNSKEYKFREPQTIKFGSQQSLGNLSRVRLGDINGDGLFDVIVGRANGRIGIALNIGTASEPQFDSVRDLMGVSSMPPCAISADVGLNPPERSTFHLLRVVSDVKSEVETYEEGFEPRPGSKGNHAIKLEFCDTKPKVFTTQLPLTDIDYGIHFRESIKIQVDKDYTLSFWVKGNGFRRLAWRVHGIQSFSTGKDEDDRDVEGTFEYGARGDYSAGSTWTNVRATFKIARPPEMKGDKPLGIELSFGCSGRGVLYMDDVVLQEGSHPF